MISILSQRTKTSESVAVLIRYFHVTLNTGHKECPHQIIGFEFHWFV